MDEDGTVCLRPSFRSARDLAGIIKPLTDEDPGDFDGWIEEAMEDEADRIVAKMQRQ